VLFDALANPHPKDFTNANSFWMMRIDLVRKARSKLQLDRRLKRSGEFERASSWVGSGNTLSRQKAEESQDQIGVSGRYGNELLRWPIHVSFGLRHPAGQDGSRTGEDTL